MTANSEDKLFKNISNEDVRILLEMIDVDSVEVKIWTKELRLYDPKDYVPDIIMELDKINLILELQSTPVDVNFSERALTYVAVGIRAKDNDKPINLVVLSTAEESKVVSFEFSEDSVFTYRVISLKDMDADEIIKTVEEKINNGLEVNRRELIYYALVPLMKDDIMDRNLRDFNNFLL